MTRLLPIVCLFLSEATLAEAANQKSEMQELTSYQQYQAWLENLLLELGADGQFDPKKGIDWSVMPGPFILQRKSLVLAYRRSASISQISMISTPSQALLPLTVLGQ
ncbi:hypothetical protein ACUIA4_07715 [Vibrio parahaemolyticus]